MPNANFRNIIIKLEKILEIQNNWERYKDYSCFSYLEPIHYNLISSFHKKNKDFKIDSNSFSSSVSTYMSRVWLYSELWIISLYRVSNIFKWNNENLIEVTNIDKWETAEIVTKKFIEKLSKNFCENNKEISETEILENIRYCLQELFNNILDHSLDRTSNYSSWHYFKDKNYIQFAIIDSWIWIKEDISKTNDDITSHKQAIMKALEKWNSGKIKNWIPINLKPYWSKENAWIWLTAVYNIIKKNGGDIIIWTWNYIFVYDSENNEEYYKKVNNWNWTYILFNFYPTKLNIYDFNVILRNLTKEENTTEIENIDFYF